MKKWIWTFTNNSMFANKYIIVNSDNGDGREVVFEIYGQDNMDMPYLVNDEIYKEEKLRHREYKKIAEWSINDDYIVATLYRDLTVSFITPPNKGNTITNDFKHKIWDKMIGGI